MQTTMSLSALPLNCPARVVAVDEHCPLRFRLRQLGLVNGAPIMALFRNRSGDPAAYAVCGTTIALRRCDAELVRVCVDAGEAR